VGVGEGKYCGSVRGGGSRWGHHLRGFSAQLHRQRGLHHQCSYIRPASPHHFGGSERIDRNRPQWMARRGNRGWRGILTSVAQDLYVWGCTIKTANTSSSNNDFFLATATTANAYCKGTFENCTLGIDGVSASSATPTIGCNHGSSSQQHHVRLINSNFLLPNTTSINGAISLQCVWLEWDNTTVTTAASQPSALFVGVLRATKIEIRNSDLTGYNPAGGVLLNVTNFQAGQVSIVNCKYSSNVSIIGGTWFNGGGGELIVINSDDGDTKTVFGYYKEQGTLLSTESIYRDGGFSVGGVNVGWHLVTTSTCSEMNPFVTPWVTGGWNASVASLNADFKIIHDSGTNLHNRNLWSEVEYVSDASFPKGTLASTRNATPFDGASVDWTSDSDTWTGTGGFASPNKQRVRATFTPAEGSAIRGRLFVGEASKTLYIEPQLILS
jgi:hypothetical protein